jgi:hypothetical protein
MNDHIKAFQQRLTTLFENKAAQFTQYSKDEPKTAAVTTQLAGLYADLVKVMRG